MAARRRQQVIAVVVGLIVLGYGWWLTDLQPFTGGATLALLGAIVVLIAVATARRLRSPAGAVTFASGAGPGFRAAVVVWSACAVVVTAWELQALRSSPRSAHPTISSLVETFEHHHVARLALYAGWVVLGWVLAS